MLLSKRFRVYKKLTEKYSSDFKLFKSDLFPVLMKWEGGSKLHKVSNDPGGYTRFGIAWNLWGEIFDWDFEVFKKITKEEARLLAFGNFYVPIKAYLVPYDVKLYYMDMAYNMGEIQAVKILQRCIGVSADGVFGRITESQVYRVQESCLKIRRERFYYKLVERKYKMSKFLKGWLNRSVAVYNYKY